MCVWGEGRGEGGGREGGREGRREGEEGVRLFALWDPFCKLLTVDFLTKNLGVFLVGSGLLYATSKATGYF